ncbi:MAG: nucleoside recognition domain-containing protein [Aeoliella sp.]
MLNKVWFWLLVVGIVYGFAKGTYQSAADYWSGASANMQQESAQDVPSVSAKADETKEDSDLLKSRGLIATGKNINAAMLDGAKTAVTLCIGLIGILALWLGLLRIATDAGLVDAVARALRPFMRLVFPDIPDGHPAQGAVLMNLSANMLGLENAATPMGLKAMQELQKLNETPDTATDSMAMFLAINTSNVTLIPIAIIAYRELYGSESPAGVLFPTLLVTSFATLVAIVAAKFLSKLPRYQLANDGLPSPPELANDDAHDEDCK